MAHLSFTPQDHATVDHILERFEPLSESEADDLRASVETALVASTVAREMKRLRGRDSGPRGVRELVGLLYELHGPPEDTFDRPLTTDDEADEMIERHFKAVDRVLSTSAVSGR